MFKIRNFSKSGSDGALYEENAMILRTFFCIFNALVNLVG